MGKKGNKRKFAEISTSSSSLAATKDEVVKYSDLPNLQKKTWVLSTELNLLDEYFKLLDWMSYWGCLEGFDFDGLTSLRCVTGYPLIELNIVYEQNSKKFLITRASQYILAFHSLICGWRVFHDTELRIDFGAYAAHQMEVPASYVGEPWKTLGLQSMIPALTDMDSDDDKIASKACMVFVVHLCEACRIKFIRLKIAQSIMPCVSTAQDLFQGEDQVLGTESCEDILPSLGPIIVDLNLVVDSDDQVVAFIKQFKQLCKAWMTYVLSRKSVCPLPENIADACGVKYVRTLRHSLSLLSNTNFRKILTEWEKKFHQRKSPTNFQQADLDFMRSMVLQFENSST